MLATLDVMLREEWRMHSLVFGNRNFSFFPVVMLVFAFMASLFLPYYAEFLSREQMAFVVHIAYLFFGVSVGGMGLLGQEALNRRLGDVSLVAYASRTLPISERTLFAVFVVKDTLYYLVFLVAPFPLGYLFAAPVAGLSTANLGLLAASVTLAFLVGLSVSLVLSTLYVRIGKSLMVMAAAASFAYTLYDPTWFSIAEFTPYFSPLAYFLYGGLGELFLSIGIVAVLVAVSFATFTAEYRGVSRRYANQLGSLAGRLPAGVHAPFVAKDLLDLKRSQGGFMKVAVSYIFPLTIVGIMVLFFARFMPIEAHHMLLIMAVMTGVVSVSLYNWLTEFDFPEIYDFLPLSASYILKAKLKLYAGFTAVLGSLTLLVCYALLAPGPMYLLLAFHLAFVIAAYTIAATAYYTGIKTTIMLYSAKVFAQYLLVLLPPIALLVVTLMTGIATGTVIAALIVLATIVLLPAAYTLLTKSYVKWETQKTIMT